ncbi:MAG: energy transducer TonB [Bacteroidetes bacterium]|nr:energy transducer TonB [Bacteroidota bacterium]
MTKQKDNSAPLDEIVFEHRNKNYGAYVLRKQYKKNLTRALFLAIAILIAGMVYPLVSSYYAQRRAKYIEKTAEAEFLDLNKPKDDAPPPPPPPPPPPAALEQKVKFVAPVVTTEEVVEETDVMNQDDLSKTTTNEPVAQVEETETAPAVQEVIEVEESKPVFTFVEEQPSFVGGDDARLKFIAQNIEYPKQAIENSIQGTVYVSFIIDSKGKVTDVKVLRGIGGGCDEEAIRVVKMMPAWHPGKNNGKEVRVQYSMPVSFKLQAPQ